MNGCSGDSTPPLVLGDPFILDAARVIGILDRVVDEFVGHLAFIRKAGARRFANRMVGFVVSEIERAAGGVLPPPRPLLSTAGWLDILQGVVDGGLPTYDSQDEVIAGLVRQLAEVLNPKGRQLLVELEAAFNARNDRWAEDRFGLGVAVGRSQLSDLLAAELLR